MPRMDNPFRCPSAIISDSVLYACPEAMVWV